MTGERSGTVEGSPYHPIYCLCPHPEHPPRKVSAVEAEWNPDERWPGEDQGHRLKFVVFGASDLVIPAPAGPNRVDGLWERTCFELFFFNPVNLGGPYCEHNFSPSGEWAAYRFERYREGRSEMDFITPSIDWVMMKDRFELRVDMDASVNPPATVRMNLTAVIEETGGHKSYWALAHPPGPPDFHNGACATA